MRELTSASMVDRRGMAKLELDILASVFVPRTLTVLSVSLESSFSSAISFELRDDRARKDMDFDFLLKLLTDIRAFDCSWSPSAHIN